MIVYNNIIQKLSEAGWSSYRIRREKVLSESVVSRIRNGESITTVTINRLCQLCNCQPGDLMCYMPDERDD